MRRRFLSIACAALLAAVPAGAEVGGPLASGAWADRTGWREAIDPQAPDLARLAAAVFAETNRVRADAGLRPFRPSRRGDRAADLQAEMGAMLMVVSHDNPRPGHADVFERAQRAGLAPSKVAENLAVTPLVEPDEPGALTYAAYAQKVVAQWMESPPHRANILSRELDHLGCSVRPKKAPNGRDVLLAVQVLFTPSRQRD